MWLSHLITMAEHGAHWWLHVRGSGFKSRSIRVILAHALRLISPTGRRVRWCPLKSVQSMQNCNPPLCWG